MKYGSVVRSPPLSGGQLYNLQVQCKRESGVLALH